MKKVLSVLMVMFFVCSISYADECSLVKQHISDLESELIRIEALKEKSDIPEKYDTIIRFIENRIEGLEKEYDKNCNKKE